MISRIFKKLSVGDAQGVGELKNDKRRRSIYQTLGSGEIRLLQLNRDTPVPTWTLNTAKLTEDLEFDALSYVWGSQKDVCKINVNGKSLKIHNNLFTVLPYLAHRHKDPTTPCRPIWIDAVCINQKDEEEKLVQISIMHKIYSMAKTVWVWFGLGPAHARRFIPDAITLLPKIIEAGKQVIHEFSEPESAQEKEYRHQNNIHEPGRYIHLDDSYGLNNLPANLWVAVEHLFNNPW
jgi:hypothetical protein